MRQVVGYEGLYAVTRNGRVWAYPKKSRSKGRWLIQHLNSGGYPYVGLYKEGVTKCMRVHRIVAMAFIPQIAGKPHINHKNGIRTDNRASNLEWCTPSENKLHAWRTGLTKVSPKFIKMASEKITAWNRSLRKLNPTQVAQARAMARRGIPHSSIAPKFNVTRRTMSRIITEGYR